MLLAMRQFRMISLIVMSLSALRAPAFAACKLSKLVEMPITMNLSKALITAKFNDIDVQLAVDSGAFFSMISAASAAELKLKLHPAPFGLHVAGIGGSTVPSVATVKVFLLQGVPIHDIEFLVGGSEVGSGSIGLLGQNVLRLGDVEYDLAKGVIRMMQAEDCKHTRLAYWVVDAQAYSVMPIDYTTPWLPQTIGTAFLNGAKIRVAFDTGAATSLLSMRAAERAGIKPDSPGVIGAGFARGIGRGTVRSYIGTFSSFKIGDEEVKNARLRFGIDDLVNVDMLIGADFFLSHRVYVANSQHLLYFTYNGGPVFNLSSSAYAAKSTEPASETSSEVKKESGEPADAAAYSRRGNAFAARRDFERALADLTQATELAPNQPDYFYQRGVIHRDAGQADPAMADFNRALELKPDDVPALTARAALKLGAHDAAGATADLDAAARLAANEDDLRFFLAQAYERADLLVQSTAQYDLWIASHPDDSRMAQALNSRCWVLALQGTKLAEALSDCNGALGRTDKSSIFAGRILDSRGLVRLRLGDYGKAIADFDNSLKLNPKSAWSLYGRGVAKTLQKNATGEADMTAATALWAPIGDEFKRRGITH
jgi:tetratricopeptide (TPR) repeat protein/predicted aspartyl protease